MKRVICDAQKKGSEEAMTKQDLENLYQLAGEIQDIERQLGKMEIKGEWDFVGDTVRDYRSGQGVSVTIRGWTKKDYIRQARLEMMLKGKREQLINQKMKLEEELENVQEATIRRIIRLRYFDRLGWEDVAIAVDGTKTGTAMRMRLKRYLENN